MQLLLKPVNKREFIALALLITLCLFLTTMKYYSLLLSCLVLTGCGQMGPLYLPDGPAPIHTSQPQAPTPSKTDSNSLKK